MKFDLSKELEYKKAKTYFERLLTQNKKIELKSIQGVRSISNNSYLHVAISIFAIHSGYTLSEMKVTLKRLCPFMIYEKNNVKFLKETHKMNDKELCEFIDWIRNKSSQEGCYIPTPDEYLENKFSIDKDIDKHKQYL